MASLAFIVVDFCIFSSGIIYFISEIFLLNRFLALSLYFGYLLELVSFSLLIPYTLLVIFSFSKMIQKQIFYFYSFHTTNSSFVTLFIDYSLSCFEADIYDWLRKKSSIIKLRYVFWTRSTRYYFLF